MAIKRRDFLKVTVGSLAVLPGISFAKKASIHPGTKDASPLPKRPNFIVIFTDDQGYADLGCYGSKDIETPRVDQLASQGIKFTDFYAQPLCGPSRTALLTGCYPIRVAEIGNEKRSFPYVHPEEILLPKMLQQAGYATGMIGKLDITNRTSGFRPELNPVRRGFDYWFGVPGANDSGYVKDLYQNETLIEKKVQLEDLTRRYTEEAVDFIRKNKDKPFFLYLAHTMPHVQLATTNQFKGKSKQGLFGDVIQELDARTGRIIDLLKDLKLDRKTIVVYTSDNGPWNNYYKYRENNHAGSAEPLRGAKGTTWEGGIRVPCIMWAPGFIPAGKVCTEMCCNMDLLPTFIKLANAKLPSDRIIDGKDISDLMTAKPGAKSPHKAFYYYSEAQLEAVRSGKWKLILPRPDVKQSPWLQRHSSYRKYFDEGVFSAVSTYRLYDLETDMGETNDLADKHPDIVERMKKLAVQARQDLGDYKHIGKGVRFYDDGPKWPRLARWRSEADNAEN
ncbi:MAG: sulfatase family protein [Planctomycetota bacterium]